MNHLEFIMMNNEKRHQELTTNNAELVSQNKQLVNFTNQLVKQNHELVRSQQHIQRGIMSLVKNVKKMSKCLDPSVAVLSQNPPVSPDKTTEISIEDMKFISPLKVSKEEAAKITDERTEHQKRVSEFEDAIARITLPFMKDTPENIYKAFYENKFGRFTGLVAVEAEAEKLGKKKQEWMGSNATLHKRHLQLKRVAKAYMDLLTDAATRATELTTRESLNPEQAYHKRASEALEIALINSKENLWSTQSKFGKSSLQKYANYLQKLENKDGAKGRPKKKRKIQVDKASPKTKTATQSKRVQLAANSSEKQSEVV